MQQRAELHGISGWMRVAFLFRSTLADNPHVEGGGLSARAPTEPNASTAGAREVGRREECSGAGSLLAGRGPAARSHLRSGPRTKKKLLLLRQPLNHRCFVDEVHCIARPQSALGYFFRGWTRSSS